MKCPNCGAARRPEDKFCSYCGDVFEKESARPPEVHIHDHQEHKAESHDQMEHANIIKTGRSSRNRLIALLLCLFLGSIGAHKFYLGQTIMGILYLFTYGIFGLGWLIDLIVLAVGQPKDKQGNLLTWQ